MELSVWTVTVATFVLRFATGLTGALLIFLLANYPEYGGPEVGPFVIGVFALSLLQLVNQETFLPKVAPLLFNVSASFGLVSRPLS